MLPKSSFCIVEDDRAVSHRISSILSEAGHSVTVAATSVEAFDTIAQSAPDCILVDILLPHIDGYDFCRRVRQDPRLRRTKIVVMSTKPYEADRREAIAMGAAGYILKPIRDNLLALLEEILLDRVELHYWGVRGTLPVPGRGTLRYGGNTSCVTMSFGSDGLFIFDAGSGIKELSDHLMQKKARINGHLFISHCHWDHINALPFLAPLYTPGNELEIMGPPNGDRRMLKLISDQMDGVYFPVTIREFGSRVSFRDLREEQMLIEGMMVETMLLSHPGACLGYKVSFGNTSLCYVTDNELFPEDTPQHDPRYVEKLADFVRGADILITDSTYTDEEYQKKIGWGHSCLTEVAKLAHRAQVKKLHLFHHDPAQSDDAIDRKRSLTQAVLDSLGSDTICEAPAEGDTFSFSRSA